MVGIYPYFAVGLMVFLILTETVVVRLHTLPRLRLTLNFIFFGIELFPRGKNKEKRDNEDRPSRTSLAFATYRTLSKLLGRMHVKLRAPTLRNTGTDPMRVAIRHGAAHAVTSSLCALFGGSPTRLSDENEGDEDTSLLLSARIPLYRFIYLVLYFSRCYRKYERGKEKWQKQK